MGLFGIEYYDGISGGEVLGKLCPSVSSVFQVYKPNVGTADRSFSIHVFQLLSFLVFNDIFNLTVIFNGNFFGILARFLFRCVEGSLPMGLCGDFFSGACGVESPDPVCPVCYGPNKVLLIG